MAKQLVFSDEARRSVLEGASLLLKVFDFLIVQEGNVFSVDTSGFKV